MAQKKQIEVDVAKIRMAIQSGIPLTITTYTLPHEMEEYMGEVLKVFLTEVNQIQMVESLSYCLKELANNAKKANTKRIYFEDHNLDINNKADYVQGMEHFKEDTLNNIDYYLQKQKDHGLYIRVIMQTRNNRVKIEVRNKAELTGFEYKRIHDKITRAQQYKSVEEGLAQLLDDSEGAGLGLVIMILVLKKIGLTDENYQVLSENGETITRLILPFSQEMQDDITELSETFVKLIDGLPEFPENITEINRVINDPNSKMSDIAQKISNDVSLTAELLRMVNSAAFGLASPCHSIGEAVKLAGLRGIKNILFSIGSIQALPGSEDESGKALWDHSYCVAFYSYNLARSLCRGANERALIDDSYVCGLLHDMGKLVFENAQSDTMEQIFKLCEEHGVSPVLFERMVAGVNHGEIGARIAEKWNFPPVIVNVIRYHHEPLTAPDEYRKLTGIIYVADLLSHVHEGMVDYSQFEPSILKEFGINSEDELQNLSDRLHKAFIRDKR